MAQLQPMGRAVGPQIAPGAKAHWTVGRHPRARRWLLGHYDGGGHRVLVGAAWEAKVAHDGPGLGQGLADDLGYQDALGGHGDAGRRGGDYPDDGRDGRGLDARGGGQQPPGHSEAADAEHDRGSYCSDGTSSGDGRGPSRHEPRWQAAVLAARQLVEPVQAWCCPTGSTLLAYGWAIFAALGLEIAAMELPGLSEGMPRCPDGGRLPSRGAVPGRQLAAPWPGLACRCTSPGFQNSTVLVQPRLAFLGDVFFIPASWPLSNVFSVGDVLIALGIVWGAAPHLPVTTGPIPPTLVASGRQGQGHASRMPQLWRGPRAGSRTGSLLTCTDVVGRDGIEPPTLRFSAARSTD
jgi:Family of unknown function (DUF5317)